MQNIFDTGEKLFFYMLIICIISSIYFNILPANKITLTIGLIFCIIYFGINLYMGYKNNLTLKEALCVGLIGCGVGLFLGLFSLYTNFVLGSTNTAIFMMMPYYSPTLSLADIFFIKINFIYPFILMILNIVLVLFGSVIKKIMNKLSF